MLKKVDIMQKIMQFLHIYFPYSIITSAVNEFFYKLRGHEL